MRVFLSVDLEGLPGISSYKHLVSKESMYGEARKIATKIVSKTAEQLKELGVEEVVVADSHGGMFNILFEELPEHVVLISGSPRPYSMVYGVEGCDAAVFLGYHARAGVPESFHSHTYTGMFYEVRVNGIPSSEYYLNALVAGEFNVPVILVGGEEKLREEVEERTPWTEFVVMKTSASHYASISYPLSRICRDLESSIKRALKKLERGEAKPLKLEGRATLEIDLKNPGLAELSSYIPGVSRVGGYTVRFQSDSIIECYKVLQLISLLSVGITKLQEIL